MGAVSSFSGGTAEDGVRARRSPSASPERATRHREMASSLAQGVSLRLDFSDDASEQRKSVVGQQMQMQQQQQQRKSVVSQQLLSYSTSVASVSVSAPVPAASSPNSVGSPTGSLGAADAVGSHLAKAAAVAGRMGGKRIRITAPGHGSPLGDAGGSDWPGNDDKMETPRPPHHRQARRSHTFPESGDSGYHSSAPSTPSPSSSSSSSSSSSFHSFPAPKSASGSRAFSTFSSSPSSSSSQPRSFSPASVKFRPPPRPMYVHSSSSSSSSSSGKQEGSGDREGENNAATANAGGVADAQEKEKKKTKIMVAKANSSDEQNQTAHTRVARRQHSGGGKPSKPTRLLASSQYLPHPDKVATGGEDAFFVSASGSSIGESLCLSDSRCVCLCVCLCVCVCVCVCACYLHLTFRLVWCSLHLTSSYLICMQAWPTGSVVGPIWVSTPGFSRENS